MTLAHGNSVWWAFSVLRQEGFNVPLADESLDLCYPFLGPDLVKLRPEFKGDEDAFGKGHEWPESQQLEVWASALARKTYLGSMLAGWAGALGLGASTPTELAAGVHKHACRFSDRATVQDQNPITTIVEGRTGWQRKFWDLAVNSIEISGKLKERVSLALDIIGSGRSEASTLIKPQLTQDKFLRSMGLAFQLGPSGDLEDEGGRLRDYSIKIGNALRADADSYPPGCGPYRSRLRFGDKRTAEISFSLDRSAHLEWDEMVSGAELKAVFTFLGEAIAVVPVFTGSGLDDLAIERHQDYEYPPRAIRIQIDGAPGGQDPDTFKWSKDGGSNWEDTTVEITGAAQDLDEGVQIKFNAVTGHVLTERWDWTSYHHSLIVTVPRLLFQDVEDSIEDGIEVVKPKVIALYNEASAGPIEWDVINATEEYLGTEGA